MKNISKIYTQVQGIMQEAALFARQLVAQPIAPREKADGSPVTNVDLAVNEFLKTRLQALQLKANWLSEEEAKPQFIHDYTWVVDPIDGTRTMMQGGEEWSISLALLMQTQPVLGVIACPMRGTLYHAKKGEGAFLNKKPLHVAPLLRLKGANFSGPLPLIKAFEAKGALLQPRVPSLALRLVYVAENKLNAGFASSSAHDWDIAGADIIIQEAGGQLRAGKKATPLYLQGNFKHEALIAGHETLFDLMA
jgi:myo-inositol-1(or 4)-monophosphatase